MIGTELNLYKRFYLKAIRNDSCLIFTDLCNHQDKNNYRRIFRSHGSFIENKNGKGPHSGLFDFLVFVNIL